MSAAFSPLDEQLQLPPGRLTPLLREWVVYLGSCLAFVQVPGALARFAHLSLNRETVRRQTEAAGSLLLQAEQAAAPALAPPADPGPATDERLQVSADGAMVRLQRDGWVEVKTVAVGKVGQRRDKDGALVAHTDAISYFSRHATADEFSQQAVVELARRGVRAARAVAGVMDGALWLQGFLDYHRPDAVRILDLPHAAEHLGKLAQGLWGEGEVAQTWQKQQIRQLREQGSGPVLAELTRLENEHGEHEALTRHGEYLRSRSAQMEYAAFRAAGWPVGSGIVESANKLVVEARLKGAGMGWAAGSLNPMLCLRNAVCNGRWAAAWEQIWAAQQSRSSGGQRGMAKPVLQQEPRAAAPAEVEVDAEVVAEVEAILEQVAAELAAQQAARAAVNGKPGPGHPWRRMAINNRP